MIQKISKIIYLVLILFYGIAIFVTSFKHLNPDFSTGFLIGKSEVFYEWYQYFFYVHIFIAPFTIIIGIFQILKPNSKIHKYLGRFYVIAVLFFAAPAGFGMSFYSLSGTPTQVIFSTIAMLWFFYTFKAYQLIKNKEIQLHKEFMMRSFILAQSAVILRIMLLLSNKFINYDPNIVYILISVLSWLPFLIAYEIYLKMKTKKML